MTRDEVIVLLGQISLVDDRAVKVDTAEQAAQVHIWSVALREVPLDFAGEAVGMHYSESAWPVMPKDIAARWRDVVRDRMRRQVGTFEPANHPGVDPDDQYGNAYVAALRAERRDVAVGGSEPVAVAELVSGFAQHTQVEPIPANEGFLAAKAAMYPRNERPKQRPELAVHCPACGASPDRKCETTHGRRPMPHSTHASRQDAYAATRGADSEGNQS